MRRMVTVAAITVVAMMPAWVAGVSPSAPAAVTTFQVFEAPRPAAPVIPAGRVVTPGRSWNLVPQTAVPTPTAAHVEPPPGPARSPTIATRGASTDRLATAKPWQGKHSLRGTATWYAYRPGQAAAGPALRRALGKSWRGRTVTVNGQRVTLTDWCACGGGRIIDLDSRTFAALAPLSRGVMRVKVRW